MGMHTFRVARPSSITAEVYTIDGHFRGYLAFAELIAHLANNGAPRGGRIFQPVLKTKPQPLGVI